MNGNGYLLSEEFFAWRCSSEWPRDEVVEERNRADNEQPHPHPVALRALAGTQNETQHKATRDTSSCSRTHLSASRARALQCQPESPLVVLEK